MKPSPHNSRGTNSRTVHAARVSPQEASFSPVLDTPDASRPIPGGRYDRLPSRLNATSVSGSAWPFKIVTTGAVSSDQILAVPSSEPVTTRRPSGLKAAALIRFSCPMSRPELMTVQLRKTRRVVVQSRQDDSPSGLKMAFRKIPLVLKRSARCRRGKSHSRAVPSPPTTKGLPSRPNST